jgi:CRISPR-associated protein Cas1
MASGERFFFQPLIRQVRSGDPANREAQAARRYWPLLFGEDFRRDREAPGVNVLLNYGYTLLRAATARAVLGAGLHPGLSLHHANTLNPMRLVDDLMEPFRPFVDLAVHACVAQGNTQLDADTKRLLARPLYADLNTEAGRTPLIACLARLASSLADAYQGNRRGLSLPYAPTALELAARRAL